MVSYGAQNATDLRVNMSDAEAALLLGQPDRLVRFGRKEKWIYDDFGIHIIFNDNKVSDVMFK